MNRYDLQFSTLPATVRVNAAQKVGFARGGLVQHRGNGFGPEDDNAIVRQFGLSGMDEFWDVVLSEPMRCDDFAHALAIHFMVIEHKPGGTDADRLASGPAASRVVDTVEVELRSALRRARIDGEPWFVEILEAPPSTKLDAKAWRSFVPSDTFIDPPPPPPDGVDLSKLKVRPRAAVEWLIAMPKRKHLVPRSLVEALQPPGIAAPTAPELVETPARKTGRPPGTGLKKKDKPFVEQIVEMVRRGDAKSVNEAAQTVVGDGSGVPGSGVAASKVDRLRRQAVKFINSGE